MASSTLGSIILKDKTYKMALVYNIVDTEVCQALDSEFGQAQVRLQIVINKNKIEIVFFFLNNYYLSFLKTQEAYISQSIKEKLVDLGFLDYNIYYKYRV